jgi:hypothetical protein
MTPQNADWLASARERARQAGKCIVCRKRKARIRYAVQMATCKQCSAEAYERVKLVRANKEG